MFSLLPKLFYYVKSVYMDTGASMNSYLIDEETLLDLVDALTARGLDLTASQAAKLSYIKNVLELEDTSQGRETEKESRV